MKGDDLDRREFVMMLMALSAGFAIGCDTDERGSAVETQLSPDEESLKRLVLALGPWPEAENRRAEDFANRFVKYAGGFYLPESAETIQGLAGLLPAGAMALEEIDLKDLSAEERGVLIQLTQQLYSFIEVRFYVADEPQWGVCLGDRTRYTQAPA